MSDTIEPKEVHSAPASAAGHGTGRWRSAILTAVIAGAVVLAALSGLSVGWYGGQHTKPLVAYASIDVSCKNGKTYTLTTGNNQGSCKNTSSGAGACADDQGNTANAECGFGCVSSHGSGSCSVKPT
jgi:hypothetical protein